MKTSIHILLLALTLTASSAHLAVCAQDVEKLPELDYYQGQLEQSYLPYFRKFAITGSTKLPGGDADIVRLAIKNENKKKNKKGNDGDSVYYWVRPKGDTTTSFRIIVKPLESLGEEYTLIMTFYMRPAVEDRTITKIIDATLDSLETLFGRKELRLSTARSTLAEVTESVLDARPAYDRRELHQLVNRQGVYSIEPHTPVYTFDDATSEWVFSVSWKDSLVTLREQRVEEAEAEADTFKQDNAGGIEKLFEKLTAEVAAAATAELRTARQEDVAELEKALTNPAGAPDLLELFLIDYDKWKEGIGTIDGPDVLEELISAIDGVRLAVGALEEAKQDRDDSLEDTSRTQVETQLKADVEQSLQNFFLEQSAFKITERTWENPTEIDRITIGTTYGFGAVVFNGEDGDDTDIFSYVGLKFYLGTVDKRIPNRYPTWRSHWAVTLGAIIGNITYKGQTMQDAVGNIKPVVGLSYDVMLKPVNHAMGLNVGAVLYRQPRVNPLATGEGDPKASLYFGVTFDLDVFNKLKDLM